MNVFISYSRKDAETVATLCADLQSGGLGVTIDKEDIFPAEPWQERLSELITTSDSLVVCVSPHLVNSSVCAWEISEGVRLGKRLIPVVIAKVNFETLPNTISRLHLIDATSKNTWTKAMSDLCAAIQTDVDWTRQHTRLSAVATRWESHGRPEDLLARGTELKKLEVWALDSSSDRPLLTDTMRSYLTASAGARIAQTRSRRLTFGAISTLATLSTLITAGWWHQESLRSHVYWHLNMRPAIPSASAEWEMAQQSGQRFADCGIGCPTMVVIPAGTFTLGSPEARFPREQPQREVVIGSSFSVGAHEITFGQWGHCVAARFCRSDISAGEYGGDNVPVFNVTWHDATRYAEWLSLITGKQYRLPSETEWEYATRAGSKTYFSFGNDAADLTEYAWYADNSGMRPQQVGRKKSNSFGLSDVHGNVAEWTQDCANENYANAKTDGSANLTGNCASRVFRGGSWAHGARMARSANRDWLLGDSSKDYIGFRLVRVLDHAQPR